MQQDNLYDDSDFFDRYAAMSRSRQGLAGAGEWRVFRELFDDLRGKDVLDLGCGYGWHCIYAARCGARSVLGLDVSERMINRAQEINADPVIRYEVCSITAFGYPEDSFECVISNLALHYLSDIGTVFRGVYRTLRAGGVFLFNIEHPVFTSGIGQEWLRDDRGEIICWPLDRYFYPGERKTVFLEAQVTKQHHTLEQIVGGILDAGFTLRALKEPSPDPSSADDADEMRRPMMLLVKAVKES